MVRVQSGDDGAHGLAEGAGQRCRCRLDDGHLQPEGTGGGGDLGSDEAAADHHQPSAAGQFVPQRAGVVQGAQGVHSGQPFGAGEGAGRGAGRDDDAVGAHLPSVGEPDRTVRRVEPDRTGAEQPLGRQVLVVRLQGEFRLAEGAGQELLGQRGPVVGAVELVPDDDQPPVVALLAQRAGRREAGERGADHGDGPHAGPAASRAAMHGGRFGASVDSRT